MWEIRKSLMTSLSQSIMATHVSSYASAVHEKGHALSNFIGFIDGSVIGIAPPKGYKR